MIFSNLLNLSKKQNLLKNLSIYSISKVNLFKLKCHHQKLVLMTLLIFLMKTPKSHKLLNIYKKKKVRTANQFNPNKISQVEIKRMISSKIFPFLMKSQIKRKFLQNRKIRKNKISPVGLILINHKKKFPKDSKNQKNQD